MNTGLSCNLPYPTPDQKRRETADRKSVKSTAPSFLRQDTTISYQIKSQGHIWVNLYFIHSTVSYGISSQPAFVIPQIQYFQRLLGITFHKKGEEEEEEKQQQQVYLLISGNKIYTQ